MRESDTLQRIMTRALVCWTLVALGCLLSENAFAQAEPAPPGYEPPGGRAPSVPPPSSPSSPYVPPPAGVRDWSQLKWHVSVAADLNLRLGSAPEGLPALGYGGGVQVTRALAPLGRARFGIGAEFNYARFSHDKANAIGPSTQYLGQAAFAGLLVVDGLTNRLHPWLAVGGGFSVGNYQDPPVQRMPMDPSPPGTMPMGVSEVAVAGLLTAGLGLDVRVYESVEVGVRSDVNLTFSSKQVGMPPREVFSPGWLSFAVGVGFRF
jgi:hypothetical protein